MTTSNSETFLGREDAAAPEVIAILPEAKSITTLSPGTAYVVSEPTDQ